MNWHSLIQLLLIVAALCVLPKLFEMRARAQGRLPGWPFVGLAVVGVLLITLATA